MGKYSIGIDFGFNSANAVLLDVENGDILASVSQEYSNGVIESFCDNSENSYTVFNPMIYLEALQSAVPAVIASAGVSKEDIIGLGIDFFTSAILPVMNNGTPLCFFDKFTGEPNAYAKLYGPLAVSKAAKINEIAAKRGEAFLARYGSQIEATSMLPLVLETLDCAPDVYNTCDCFIETADWIVWQLTGKQTRNACAAGLSALWSKTEGYPDSDFYAALDPRLSDFASKKLNCEVSPAGTKAGVVSPFVANALGLSENTAVSVAHFNASSSLIAAKLVKEGQMLSFMDDASSHILLGSKENYVPGITAAVMDGIVPELVSYEATQLGAGESLSWFVNRLMPATLCEEAKVLDMTDFDYLNSLAVNLKPGETGIIALDWTNGSRAVLSDSNLSSIFLGMTTETKSEDMYRALIESSAFGMRSIIENFNTHSVPVKELVMTGELTKQDVGIIQIYSDILKLPIKLVSDDSLSLIGAAILGATAAGSEAGGYDSVADAACAMGVDSDVCITPCEAHASTYDKLFQEYTRLVNYFGRGANDCMKRLKNIKDEVSAENEPCDNMEELIEEVYNAVDELATEALVVAEEAEESAENDELDVTEDDILEEEDFEETIEDLMAEDGIESAEELESLVDYLGKTPEDPELVSLMEKYDAVEDIEETTSEDVTSDSTEEVIKETVSEVVEETFEEAIDEVDETIEETVESVVDEYSVDEVIANEDSSVSEEDDETYEEEEDDEDEPFVPTLSSEFGEEYVYNSVDETNELAAETEVPAETIEEVEEVEKPEPASAINRNSSIPSDFWNY